MEMDPSEDQEVMKLVEIDPDLSDTAESEEKKLNAIFVSALDMILKSLCNISVFLSALLMDYVQEAHHSLTVDESVLPQDILRIFLLKHLSLAHPLETNGVSKLFPKILELLPRWNSHFEVNEVAKTICIRCKTDMAYSGERSSGIIINANSLRVFKSVFRDFTFETIVKVIRINVKMLCDKEGCGKRNYVQRMINKLPTVFTIALQWENNETEKEIFDTASVLATEIDISAIYRYKGDSPYTKYRLISMVWSHGDLYNCVAYKNNRWVKHYCSDIEVIGDWHSVLSIFRELHIRPEILFFENVMQRDQMFSAQRDMDYPIERSFGIIINANSLREVKFSFKDYTFENIIKVIKMNLKIPCDKEGCEKQSYVHRMIYKLPSVFTIALEWTKNETEGEILDTTSVLATEIDISVIYQYIGDSPFTKYRLVSMVCSHEDRYNCVAYEKNRWVRYFLSEKEVIGGDWESVVNIFVTQNIRPQILFFESVMQRDQIVSGQRSNDH